MTLDQLKQGQLVTYRTGRDAGGDSTEPNWSEWKQGALYVVRRDTDLPKKYRRRLLGEEWREGYLLTLAVHGWPCEYSGNDYQGNGLFLAEDWYLEIENML